MSEMGMQIVCFSLLSAEQKQADEIKTSEKFVRIDARIKNSSRLTYIN